MADSTGPARTGVLVVDDDHGVRSLLVALLTRAGYAPRAVTSAEEALAELEQAPCEVVLTDIVLPGADGFELVERVKQSNDADVVVMTGYVDSHSYEEAVGMGASDFILKPIRAEELVLRLRRIVEARRQREEHQRMLAELRKLVITDSLTALFNSRHFHSQIGVEAGRASRYRRPLSLLLLDIDHFKQYNDRFGHLEGDLALSTIGATIRSCLRETDSAYRYGGEEFTALLPETAGQEAVNVAERIRKAVESVTFTPAEGVRANVTVSIGATDYSPGESAESFIERADKTMYLAKQRGRNCVASQFIGSD